MKLFWTPVGVVTAALIAVTAVFDPTVREILLMIGIFLIVAAFLVVMTKFVAFCDETKKRLSRAAYEEDS